jgi:membrane fusion protein (multidrug efflux system)
MATEFTRTVRSLRADGFRQSIAALFLAGALLTAWAAWLLYARVARYETTDSARLEVDRATYAIQAPYTGRVVSSRLALGSEVRADEILVELDSNSERLQIEEQRAQRGVLDPQIDSIRGELAVAGQARAREQDAARTALEEARARVREAEAAARFAIGDVGRYKQLYELGIGAEREYALAQAAAGRSSANLESLQQTARRLEQEQLTRETDRDAQIQKLETEIRRLEGEKITTAASIDKLQYDAEKRRIRAPVAGRVGEAATLRVGAVVREGDKLGTIVPSGRLRIVAEFEPSAALGRIHPGQSARLRLKGFPWAQYGSITARVATIADEIRDGHVRVECDLAANAPALIPTQHGLPGSIEVEVEHLSPLQLVLRAAGQWIAAPRSASATP